MRLAASWKDIPRLRPRREARRATWSRVICRLAAISSHALPATTLSRTAISNSRVHQRILGTSKPADIPLLMFYGDLFEIWDLLGVSTYAATACSRDELTCRDNCRGISSPFGDRGCACEAAILSQSAPNVLGCEGN